MIRRPPRSTLFPYTTPSDLDGTSQLYRWVVTSSGVQLSGAACAGCHTRIHADGTPILGAPRGRTPEPDRKSTRLNSSHANISYAVFCLKKKKTSIAN